MADMATTDTSVRAPRQVRVGTVVADNRSKTIKVRLDLVQRLRKYGKFIRRSTVLHVHDEKNEAKAGDVVELASCRRLSKTKSWRLVRVVRKAESLG